MKCEGRAGRAAVLNQMTKQWVNVIAMTSLHARVVYRPSLELYLYVSDDPYQLPVTAVITVLSRVRTLLWFELYFGDFNFSNLQHMYNIARSSLP